MLSMSWGVVLIMDLDPSMDLIMDHVYYLYPWGYRHMMMTLSRVICYYGHMGNVWLVIVNLRPICCMNYLCPSDRRHEVWLLSWLPDASWLLLVLCVEAWILIGNVHSLHWVCMHDYVERSYFDPRFVLFHCDDTCMCGYIRNPILDLWDYCCYLRFIYLQPDVATEHLGSFWKLHTRVIIDTWFGDSLPIRRSRTGAELDS